MHCRRGKPIDKNGMPILVEKDPNNRDKYLEQLQSKLKSVHQNSTTSFISSVNKLSMRDLSKPAGNGRKSSLASLTQKTTSSRKRITSHSPLKIRGKEWLHKVDDLISKFDESFR